MKDVTFFKKDEQGCLRQLSRSAPDNDIMSADRATLKLELQKIGWHGVCVHQQWNGDEIFDPIRALGRRYCYIRRHHQSNWDTYLSAYFDTKNKRHDVSDKDISKALKEAAAELLYPERKGIPLDHIDTHSLRVGGDNALSLSGYSDREIQKMGRWRGETFKEFI